MVQGLWIFQGSGIGSVQQDYYGHPQPQLPVCGQDFVRLAEKAGVRGLADIKDLDAKRTAAREESGESREKRLQKYDSGVSSARQGSGARKNTSNQFHNFKQRDTDYDALVLKQVKEWVGQQP